MSKFKVGDRVISHSDGYGITKKGWIGIVTRVYDCDGGHYIAAKGPGDGPGRGHEVTFSALRVKDFDLCFDVAQKIVVTTDGKTTTARLFDGKKCVKTAEAKLSKKDTFSFKAGAALAVDRLLGREEKKPAEPEPPKFPKEKMVTGVFGRENDGDWFVVADDKLVYEGGRFRYLSSVIEDGTFPGPGHCEHIDCLVSAVCFNSAKSAARSGGLSVIWKRPGAKFK